MCVCVCVCVCKREYAHAHAHTLCVSMWVCAFVCILALHVKLLMWVQHTVFDFLNSSVLPAPAPKNEVEVHAKMLWVSIENFSSWMQSPDSFWLCFRSTLSSALALLWGREKISIGKSHFTFPFHSLLIPAFLGGRHGAYRPQSSVVWREHPSAVKELDAHQKQRTSAG